MWYWHIIDALAKRNDLTLIVILFLISLCYAPQGIDFMSANDLIRQNEIGSVRDARRAAY